MSDEGALFHEAKYVEVHNSKATEADSKCPSEQSFQLFVHYDSKTVSHGSARL